MWSMLQRISGSIRNNCTFTFDGLGKAFHLWSWPCNNVVWIEDEIILMRNLLCARYAAKYYLPNLQQCELISLYFRNMLFILMKKPFICEVQLLNLWVEWEMDSYEWETICLWDMQKKITGWTKSNIMMSTQMYLNIVLEIYSTSSWTKSHQRESFHCRNKRELEHMALVKIDISQWNQNDGRNLMLFTILHFSFDSYLTIMEIYEEV